MKKHLLLIISIALFIAFAFTSCETATGQGAGWGAATGAVLGAVTTGDARGAAVGALIGANTGAIIGASIDEAHAMRYGPPPRGGFPYASPTDRPGFYVSPYPPHQIYNLRMSRTGASWMMRSAAVVFENRRRFGRARLCRAAGFGVFLRFGSTESRPTDATHRRSPALRRSS